MHLCSRWRLSRNFAPWLLCAALATFSVPALALERQQVFDLEQKAPSGGTWADWMRSLFPGLALEPASADDKTSAHYIVHRSKPIRALEGEAFGDGDCDGAPIQHLDIDRMQVSNQTRYVVGVTMTNECAAILALFDGRGDALDSVDVRRDRSTVFGERFVQSLGPEASLVTVANFHTGAGAGGDETALILADKDKLSLITTIFGDYAVICDSVRNDYRGHNTGLTAIVTPDYGDHDRIVTYVKTVTTRYADDCQTPLGRPGIAIDQTVWRWNYLKRVYEAVSSGRFKP